MSVGTGVLVYCLLTDSLTIQAAGLVMFFWGLVPVTRADAKAAGGDTASSLFRKAVLAWLQEGKK